MSSKKEHIADKLYRPDSAYNTVARILASSNFGITRAKLIEKAQAKGASVYDVGVVLSPTEDNRGNISASGHLYYVPRTPIKDSKRTLKYFPPVLRETPMEPLRRHETDEEREARAQRLVERQAKAKAKAEAEAKSKAEREHKREVRTQIEKVKKERWAVKKEGWDIKRQLKAAEKAASPLNKVVEKAQKAVNAADDADADLKAALQDALAAAKSANDTIADLQSKVEKNDAMLEAFDAQLAELADGLEAVTQSEEAPEVAAETSENIRATEDEEQGEEQGEEQAVKA